MSQLLKFKNIKRETAGNTPKHKKQKRNKEKQRETQVNRFDYKCGLQRLSERDPKPKHTKTCFILKPILTFPYYFPAISLLIFLFCTCVSLLLSEVISINFSLSMCFIDGPHFSSWMNTCVYLIGCKLVICVIPVLVNK